MRYKSIFQSAVGINKEKLMPPEESPELYFALMHQKDYKDFAKSLSQITDKKFQKMIVHRLLVQRKDLFLNQYLHIMGEAQIPKGRYSKLSKGNVDILRKLFVESGIRVPKPKKKVFKKKPKKVLSKKRPSIIVKKKRRVHNA